MTRTVKYLAVLLIVVLYSNTGYAKTNACLACHKVIPEEQKQNVTDCWLRSIHRQNGVTCDACHGGNPDVQVSSIKSLSNRQFDALKALSMSRSRGFIGIPSPAQMFDMCSQCHGDSVNSYKNSIMGGAYLDNKGGPSCTDCHSAHYVIIPDVPKSCEKCHKDTTGFDQIDPMNVNDATVTELSRLRIKLAEEKIKGKEPPLFPEELGSFQIGFVAFGAIILLFIIAFIIYILIEKRR
ncbi:MAG: cytochrome c3 family protein [Deltaproteobacteria bacterium]|nr:cytochrome c3 family protein [Deltaproteobacteria bacterium]MCL5277345.1 cytochrome c3 family protein [Deltaproteobacteria bacterium]